MSVPSAQRTSILYCRLTDFWRLSNFSSIQLHSWSHTDYNSVVFPSISSSTLSPSVDLCPCKANLFSCITACIHENTYMGHKGTGPSDQGMQAWAIAHPPNFGKNINKTIFIKKVYLNPQIFRPSYGHKSTWPSEQGVQAGGNCPPSKFWQEYKQNLAKFWQEYKQNLALLKIILATPDF